MTDILASPEFGQFIVNMLVALVTILVPLIGSAARSLVKSNANNTQFQTLMSIARTAVLAAEQAGLAGLIVDKKEAAVSYAQAMLTDRGMSIDISALDAAIEAAVAQELNRPVINEASYQKAANRGIAP